jgi:hypothetical protein
MRELPSRRARCIPASSFPVCILVKVEIECCTKLVSLSNITADSGQLSAVVYKCWLGRRSYCNLGATKLRLTIDHGDLGSGYRNEYQKNAKEAESRAGYHGVFPHNAANFSNLSLSLE